MSNMVEVNGLNIHYLEYNPDAEQTLILLHGLSANAHTFVGLVKAGLADDMRVIFPDLRGRGKSSQPETGYSMGEHAADIIALMDALNIDKAILGGHSFGGLLAIYMAAIYHDRVEKLVILDAGILHDKVADMVKPSSERLEKVFPNWEDYIEGVKNSSYYADGFWDDDLEAFYRSDIKELPDGSITTITRKATIEEVSSKVLTENWMELMKKADQEALLLLAPENFGDIHPMPIMTEENANLTANFMANCKVVKVEGHHISMVFGKFAPRVVSEIKAFL